jgi:hypothetical protein
MAILLPSEKGDFLTLAEGEALFSSFYRASLSRTIASGVITIPGSGRYKLEPESGTTDDLTGITLTGESVEGTLIQLRCGTAGRTITVKHQANLHLANEQDAVLSTIYSTIFLRHYGGNVWAQEGSVTYTV